VGRSRAPLAGRGANRLTYSPSIRPELTCSIPVACHRTHSRSMAAYRATPSGQVGLGVGVYRDRAGESDCAVKLEPRCWRPDESRMCLLHRHAQFTARLRSYPRLEHRAAAVGCVTIQRRGAGRYASARKTDQAAERARRACEHSHVGNHTGSSGVPGPSCHYVYSPPRAAA